MSKPTKTIDFSQDTHIIVAVYSKVGSNPKSIKATFPDGRVVTIPISPPKIEDGSVGC